MFSLCDRQIESILQAAIRTSGDVKLPESHAAAACDVLRVCLAQCERSNNPELQAITYRQQTWEESFMVFLHSSENRNQKALKQLLVALEQILTRNPSDVIRNSLIGFVSSKTYQIICQEGKSSSIKPALQALRHFTSKSIIQVPDIALAVSRKASVDGSWRSAGNDEALSHLDPSLSQAYIKCLDEFLSNIVQWLRYPDVAPISGRLISSVCQSLQHWRSYSRIHYLSLDPSTPIWLSPIKAMIKDRPDLVELFGIHVLPEIARQDREGMSAFLGTLPLQELRSGSAVHCSAVDIQLCLLAVKLSRVKKSSKIDSKCLLLSTSPVSEVFIV